MPEILFAIASFLLAAFAFVFGAAKLFKKKIPLYWQLIVCAAGCFAMQQLSCAVRLWCGASEEPDIGMLGIFGCNLFLFSANYGTLDGIVDDGFGTRSARRFALLAPALLALLAAAVFFAWKEKNLLCAVVWVVLLLTALGASYFNLKHLLLPMDPFEFLRATRQSNLAALVFYGLTAFYGIVSASGGAVVCGLISVATSGAVLWLALCAIEGAKKWAI